MKEVMMSDEKTWNHRCFKSLTTVYPGPLIDGYCTFVVSLVFSEANNFCKGFSNMISKSVATPLTDLDGDDIRFMVGNINKISAPISAAPSTLCSVTKEQAICKKVEMKLK